MRAGSFAIQTLLIVPTLYFAIRGMELTTALLMLLLGGSQIVSAFVLLVVPGERRPVLAYKTSLYVYFISIVVFFLLFYAVLTWQFLIAGGLTIGVAFYGLSLLMTARPEGFKKRRHFLPNIEI